MAATPFKMLLKVGAKTFTYDLGLQAPADLEEMKEHLSHMSQEIQKESLSLEVLSAKGAVVYQSGQFSS